ncbi:MAG: MFS transporter [Aeromonas veronii]
MLKMKEGKNKRWFTLAIIVLTIAVMTELPYMRWAMYEPLREALGMTNTEFGESMSLFGLLSMFLYIPGGLLADRVSHRKLFAGGAIGGGILGLWFMTLPSATEVLIIHALFSITNIMMVWPTMIKAVSVLGDESEQGKLFGIFEGARGLVLIGVTTTMTTILAVFGSEAAGVSKVIGFVAIASMLCGILAWFLMEDNVEPADNRTSFSSIMHDMKMVIKMPSAWICAGIMFSVYCTYSVSTYMNPYMQQTFGLTAVMTGYLTVIRKDIIRLFAAPLSGYITTRVGGQNAKVISWYAIATIMSLIALIVAPEGSSFIVVMAITCVSSFCLYGMRGLYYAVIGEVGTPKYIYGAVAGFCSMIAFAPDAFNTILVGSWLDKYGVEGYKMTFYYMIGTMLLSIALCYVLIAMKKKGIKFPSEEEYNAEKKRLG